MIQNLIKMDSPVPPETDKGKSETNNEACPECERKERQKEIEKYNSSFERLHDNNYIKPNKYDN